MIKHYLNGLLTYEISFTKLNSKFLSIFFFRLLSNQKKWGFKIGVWRKERGVVVVLYIL